MRLAQGGLHACIVAGSLLCATPGWSAETRPEVEPPRQASVARMLAKSTTATAASVAVLATVFWAGTGSFVAGGMLTAGTAALMYTVYPTNEYLWDYFYPAGSATRADGSFDVGASLWRTTAKYVTFKTSIVTTKFAWIYAYTGSAYATLTLGGISSLALPGVFYANDIAWDWYDWSQRQPAAKPASP